MEENKTQQKLTKERFIQIIEETADKIVEATGERQTTSSKGIDGGSKTEANSFEQRLAEFYTKKARNI